MLASYIRMNQFGAIQVREGDLLAGKYRIERVIGVGGMGVVVAARHEQLEQLVAIKFVRDDALDNNDEAVERFLREARSAARLRSEHVARVLDVGRLESGAPYMVMEYLEGADLAQTLTRDGAMAVELAVSLMIQVCEAVAEAHAAGIVHRDLKPENLFLTRTLGGTPKMKVLDFGVSKSARLADPKNKLTGTRTVLGSPLYMPPEQMRSSRDVDARGDVWALGVVLFELLAGRSPFDAETMPELCLKIVSEPPLSLAELRPGLPPALVGVVECCFEKDRNKRYENAGELARALAPFAPAGPIVFSPWPVADSNPPGSPFEPPGAGSFHGDPPRIASIPAAWGTEEHGGSQEPAPRQGTMMAWAAVVALAIGAAAVAFALGHGGASPQPAALPVRLAEPPPATVDMPSLAAPPPAVEIGSALAPPVPLPLPVESPLASAAAPSSAAEAKTGPSPGGHPAARSTAMPAVAGTLARTLAKPDDDIPSLR
jgi:serine/threonine protein kinase